MIGNRRDFFRVAAPAVALPMLSAPLQAKEVRLVTRDEIMDAFKFYDRMELRAEDLNLRYQILIDMLFETNPETLRARLQQLVDSRKGRMVLVDADTAQVAPYDPSMYDAATGELVAMGQQHIDQEVAPLAQRLQQATGPHIALPKPKLRYRLAARLWGWRA
jgi:hypothetical protein